MAHLLLEAKQRCGNEFNSVPTLVQLCVFTVIDNIDHLEDVGDVPLEFLERFLSVCSPEQLQRVETATSRSLETEPFWMKHCELKKLSVEDFATYEAANYRELYKNYIRSVQQQTKAMGLAMRRRYKALESKKMENTVKVLDRKYSKRRRPSTTHHRTGSKRSQSTRRVFR